MNKLILGPLGKEAHKKWMELMKVEQDQHNLHVTKLGFKHKSQKRLDREAKHKSNYHL